MNYNQNYNNYNQGYNQGYNEGYDNYNQNNNNNNNSGGGFLSTLIALAALIGLVYLLLRLLGIDAMDYIEKYIKKDGDNTEEKEPTSEKPSETPTEIKKISVKETLKTYCTKIDSSGNYLLEELDEEDAMEGNLTFCQDNTCYFTRAKKTSSTDTKEDTDEDKESESKKEDSEDKKDETDKDDKKDKTNEDDKIDYEEGILYSYNCQDKTYIEMDATKNINEMRIDIACDIYKEKGTFEHEMTDGTSIKCENNNCYFDNNGAITTHSCPINEPVPPES